jgi:hypothetical protein
MDEGARHNPRPGGPEEIEKGETNMMATNHIAGEPCLRCGHLKGYSVEKYSPIGLRARIKRIKSNLKRAIKFSDENAKEYGLQETSYGDGLRKALEIVMGESK